MRRPLPRRMTTAWRAAYQGIIPGAELERLINRRGPDWWGLSHPQRQPGRDPRLRQHDRRLRQLRPQPRAQPLLRRRDLRALSAAGIPGPRLRPQAVLGGAARPHPERLAEPRGLGVVGQRVRGRVLSLARRPRGGALIGAVRHQGARQGRLRLERQRQRIIRPRPNITAAVERWPRIAIPWSFAFRAIGTCRTRIDQEAR